MLQCVSSIVCVFLHLYSSDSYANCMKSLSLLVSFLCFFPSRVVLDGHMFLFLEGRQDTAAAQSVNALYSKHEGTRRHVIAGWNRPNSIRITQIPQYARVS